MELFKCTRCGCDTPNSEDITSSEGKLLFISHMCDACKKRLRQEVDFRYEGATFSESELICPWCGHEYETYDACGFDEGETESVVCERCGKHFDLEIETRRRYSTKRSLCDMPDDYEEQEDE